MIYNFFEFSDTSRKIKVSPDKNKRPRKVAKGKSTDPIYDPYTDHHRDPYYGQHDISMGQTRTIQPNYGQPNVAMGQTRTIQPQSHVPRDRPKKGHVAKKQVESVTRDKDIKADRYMEPLHEEQHEDSSRPTPAPRKSAQQQVRVLCLIFGCGSLLNMEP